MKLESLEIDIQVLCSIEPPKVDAFVALLKELIPILGGEEISSLKRILIVEDNQVADMANSIIKLIESTASYTPNSNYAAQAVTIPVENEGKLDCFIVMSEAFLKSLTIEHYHDSDTVLTLLEELLHVWVFNKTWQRRGYINHGKKAALTSCKVAILTVASQMCDEYIAIRKKSELIANIPLVEPVLGKGLTTAKISYGGNVLETLNQGFTELEKTIIAAASGEEEISNSWHKVVKVVYRGVFEALSRDSAYRDGTTEENSAEKEFETLKFYRELLANHWHEIHYGLKRIFDSNLSETEIVLEEIANSLHLLLKTIGVSYRKTEDGGCWVDFETSFFDKWQKEQGIG